MKSSMSDLESGSDDIKKFQNVKKSSIVDVHKSLMIESGPFFVHPLIEALPLEFTYTCFDAYEGHIYLGTSTGELLHYFEIECRNYMLVSQTKFDNVSLSSIDKLLLLPNIEKAVILSGKSLKLFLLPEFAPVPNIDPLDHINDFSVFQYSPSSNCYKGYIYSENSIQYVKFTLNGLLFLKDYSYKKVKKACVEGEHIIMACRNSKYELIDLKLEKSTPLFQISQSEMDLPPVITSFSNNEFLVTCGTSKEEKSMALILNHQGDMTHSTIVLEQYPQNIIVQYPFILIDFNELGIYIYKFDVNNEPRLVQKITYHGKKICIDKTVQIFTNIHSNQKVLVVEKLRLIPLSVKNSLLPVEQEVAYIDSIFREESSLALYGSAGIFLLYAQSRVLEFDDYYEDSIDAIRRTISNMNQYGNLSKYQHVELKYLKTLLLLLLTFHSSEIDVQLAIQWCEWSVDVDIRILLYIYDYEIFGDLWIFNGLHKFVSELKTLKIVHKSIDPIFLTKTILNTLKTKYKDQIYDSGNVFLSLDMICLNDMIEGQKDIDIDEFSEESLLEVSKVLKLKKINYSNILVKIYEKLGDLPECLTILRKGNVLDFSRFILTHLSKLLENESYKNYQILEDIIYISNCDTCNQEDVLADIIFEILIYSDITPKKILNRVINHQMMVNLLERMGVEEAKDVDFLITYYFSQLEKCITENKLWDDFNDLFINYVNDTRYLKPTIHEYLGVKLKYDSKYHEFNSIQSKLLIHLNTTNLPNFYKRIKDIDSNSILTILVFDTRQLETLLGKEIALKMFFTFNDFISIEKYITEENFITIMKQYLSFENKQTSLIVIHTFLLRNIGCVNNPELLIEIIKQIPKYIELHILFDILFPLLRKIDAGIKKQNIKKAIIKRELNITKHIINNLNIDNN